MPIVPIFSYSRRTGVTTLRTLIRSLCKIYDKFEVSIRTWVSDNMSTEDAAVVQGWLDLLSSVCILVEGTPDD